MHKHNMRIRFHGLHARSQGFTLIELLLVMVILATIVIPRFTKRTEQANLTAATTMVENISQALRFFAIDCGRLPTTEEGLRALMEQPANVKNWKGPYLEKGIPKDPWDTPYVYRCPGNHNNDFDLYSFGPDRNEGGGDDVDNWTQQ